MTQARFHGIATIAGAICLALAGLPARAIEIAQVAPVGPFIGTCAASAVVTYPPGTVDQYMIVGNDEENVLQSYRVTASPLTVLATQGPTQDMSGFLGVDGTKNSGKVDIEAATWLDGRAVWVGSHSRSGTKGERRPARGQLFTTEIVLENDVLRVRPVQKAPTDALLKMLGAADAIGQSIALDKEEDSNLVPKKAGFNIEGMSVAANGTSLVLGLRGPSADGRAYLLTIDDAARLLGIGAAAFDPSKHVWHVRMVQLRSGLGIRSLEYAPARKLYFLIAGATADDDAKRPDFDLYAWDGIADRPMVVPGLRNRIEAAGIAGFQPEALAVDSTGTKLLILSDDENRCNGSNSFRGVIVTLK